MTCQNHYDYLIPHLSSRPLIQLSLPESDQQDEELYVIIIVQFWFLSSLYYRIYFYCSTDKKFQSGVGSQYVKGI